MLYDDSAGSVPERSDDTEPDPQQLLDDLAALVDAGLVVPVREPGGEVRMTPAGPLPAAGELDGGRAWPA
jgi:hypothetical protein